jgi:hypothetical protein
LVKLDNSADWLAWPGGRADGLVLLEGRFFAFGNILSGRPGKVMARLFMKPTPGHSDEKNGH